MLKKKKSIGAFKVGEFAIFPIHGVALISDITETVVAGNTIECMKLDFQRKSMSILLPEKKIEIVGLRHLIPESEVDVIINLLKETSKFLRVIWNRRSKEYESKIQSGSIYSCAEVVRDLYKNTNNPNRSYTEAVIYEEALYRITSELAIIQNKEYTEVEKEIKNILNKYHETYQSLNNTFGDEIIEEESLENIDYKKVANA